MATQTLNDDLTAAITWALDRIVRNEFKEARDGAGNIDSMVLDKDFAAAGSVPAGRGNGSAAHPRSRADGSALPPQPAPTTRCYAEEMRNLFPKLVERAKSLRTVPSTTECPDYARRFLVEASRCIVYGQFLAALFLCRSALAESLVVTLRKKGHAQELASIKDESLKGIFKLARETGLLDSTHHHRAEEIRLLANQTIHGSTVPTEDACIGVFNVTVGIVRGLAA